MLSCESILEMIPVVWKLHPNTACDSFGTVFPFVQTREVPQIPLAVRPRNVTRQPFCTASFKHVPYVPTTVSRYLLFPPLDIVFGLVRAVASIKCGKITDRLPK